MATVLDVANFVVLLGPECTACILSSTCKALRTELISIVVDRPWKCADPSLATPLHLAAFFGCMHSVRQLLFAGASADSLDKTHRTPLMCMARSRWFRRDIGSVLLAAGADPLAADEDGETALAHAARDGQHDALAWLLDECAVPIDIAPCSGKFSGYSALHVAARAGDEVCTQILLSRNAPIEVLNGDTATPLMLLAANGSNKRDCPHSECLKLLLDADADPLTSDEDGWIALHFAAKAGCLAMVELLLGAGHASEQATTTTDGHCHFAPDCTALDLVEAYRHNPASKLSGVPAGILDSIESALNTAVDAE